MEITEIRVKLVQDNSERLKAFCSVTFDGMFVVRDVKVIEGPSGPFVAMPSRKLTDRCPRCASKNHLRSRYCSSCGAKLNENRATSEGTGRVKLHADVAHPIHSECRRWLQEAVVEAYQRELRRASEPGYVAPALDDYDDYEEVIASLGGDRGVARESPVAADPPAKRPAADEPEHNNSPHRRKFGAGILD